jgi:hypothetical protein
MVEDAVDILFQRRADGGLLSLEVNEVDRSRIGLGVTGRSMRVSGVRARSGYRASMPRSRVSRFALRGAG